MKKVIPAIVILSLVIIAAFAVPVYIIYQTNQAKSTDLSDRSLRSKDFKILAATICKSPRRRLRLPPSPLPKSPPKLMRMKPSRQLRSRLSLRMLTKARSSQPQRQRWQTAPTAV